MYIYTYIYIHIYIHYLLLYKITITNFRHINTGIYIIYTHT